MLPPPPPPPPLPLLPFSLLSQLDESLWSWLEFQYTNITRIYLHPSSSLPCLDFLLFSFRFIFCVMILSVFLLVIFSEGSIYIFLLFFSCERFELASPSLYVNY